MPSYYTRRFGFASLLCVALAVPLAIAGKGAAAFVVGVFGVVGCILAWRKYQRETGKS
jgi:hypothetical protein